MKLVPEHLLSYLRKRAGRPDLAYRSPPESIALGAETWVFGFELARAPDELSGPLVLRLFPSDADPEQARFEHVVQNALADQGYPAPRSVVVCTDPAPLGGPFLVMERIAGKMLLDELFGGNLWLRAPALIAEALRGMPRSLARHQLALHALDPGPLEQALRGARIPERLYRVSGKLRSLTERIEAARLDGLQPGARWLTEHQPSEPDRPRVCHCDFLPPNLIVDRGELAGVIDWSHLTLGHPEWDVVNSRLRLAMNPLEAPRALQAIGSLVRGRVTRVYERAYTTERPLDAERMRYYELMLTLWLLVDVGEHRRAGAPEDEPGRSPNPWLEPRNATTLIRHARRVGGVDLALP